MPEQSASPREELESILSGYHRPLDESDSLRLVVELREAGVLSDADWAKVLEFVRDAMKSVAGPSGTVRSGASFLDADALNEDWIRIVRARRQAGARLPSWAALWLWWVGFDYPEETFWKQVGEVARKLGFPVLKERQDS